MSKIRILPVLLVAFILAALVTAGTVERKYPDGTVLLKYQVNDETGDKEGTWEEFYPSGKSKLKANYKRDMLDGPYKSFHENGKPKITAIYKNDEFEGAFVEETEQGQKKLTATYKEGKLNGPLTRFENGKPVLTTLYKDGEVAYSRSLDEIKKKVNEILSAPVKNAANAEAEAALRRLKVYRYLAEVPYADVVLDDEFTKGAQAAAMICEKLGKLDHNPSNPGLPEAEYKVALNGAKNSNLAGGGSKGGEKLELYVDTWLFDSDPSNIGRLGHRRSALNPTMGKTGFGKSGRFAAMWSSDRSTTKVPDFEYVAYPPRGLAPVEFFGPNHAWCVLLNPRKYKQPTDSVQAKIYQVDALFNKQGEPLKLNYNKVNNSFGQPHAVIFRPDRTAVAPGNRYLVEIEGLTASSGTPLVIRYLVEFVTLR